jgi:hypothetical protein
MVLGDHLDNSQCVLALPVNRPHIRLPRNTPPRIDRKYPTLKVITASILHCGQCEYHSARQRSYLQQITHTCYHNVQCRHHDSFVGPPWSHRRFVVLGLRNNQSFVPILPQTNENPEEVDPNGQKHSKHSPECDQKYADPGVFSSIVRRERLRPERR